MNVNQLARKEEVIQLYEQEAFSAAEIAEETGLEIEAVKFILHEKSQSYRMQKSKCDAIIGEVFGEQEHRMALAAIRDLAFECENPMVRLKAAVYINEERTQRNQDRVDKLKDNRVDALSRMAGMLSVIEINERMLKAREAMGRARETKYVSQPIRDAITLADNKANTYVVKEQTSSQPQTTINV